jgi:uncharacterized protein (DUF3084 family)
MSENALFCPPKQQAVVVSYIPQAVHSTTSLAIFFNLPKIRKPTCGFKFGTL